MQCPRCGLEQDDRNTMCEVCPTVLKRPDRSSIPERGSASPAAMITYTPPLKARVFALFLDPKEPASRHALVGRALVFLLLLVWGGRLIFSTVEGGEVGRSFLHNVNLPFHEAGHIFFSPFGDFMGSLGGTLMQLLMPLICAAVLLLKTRDPFGASVAVWWFGENFLDIAPYINDARAGVLPLLGGNFGHSAPYGFHDWEFILTESGLLNQDHQIAQLSHGIGSFVMVLALVWGATVLLRGYRRQGRESRSDSLERAA